MENKVRKEDLRVKKSKQAIKDYKGEYLFDYGFNFYVFFCELIRIWEQVSFKWIVYLFIIDTVCDFFEVLAKKPQKIIAQAQ